MKKNMNRRAILIVLLIALLLIGAVGGTVAYLMTQTSEVKNVFQPAGVPSEVEESFNGETKTDVVIRNNGNVPAYIRAAIVVTWKDANGKIYPKNPVEDVDYTLSIGGEWTKNDRDGFYYYQNIVPATKSTYEVNNSNGGYLIQECKLKESVAAPTGYSLNVEIIGQAIQAEGMDAANAQDAWAKAVTTP